MSGSWKARLAFRFVSVCFSVCVSVFLFGFLLYQCLKDIVSNGKRSLVLRWGLSVFNFVCVSVCVPECLFKTHGWKLELATEPQARERVLVVWICHLIMCLVCLYVRFWVDVWDWSTHEWWGDEIIKTKTCLCVFVCLWCLMLGVCSIHKSVFICKAEVLTGEPDSRWEINILLRNSHLCK